MQIVVRDQRQRRHPAVWKASLQASHLARKDVLEWLRRVANGQGDLVVDVEHAHRGIALAWQRSNLDAGREGLEAESADVVLQPPQAWVGQSNLHPIRGVGTLLV